MEPLGIGLPLFHQSMSKRKMNKNLYNNNIVDYTLSTSFLDKFVNGLIFFIISTVAKSGSAILSLKPKRWVYTIHNTWFKSKLKPQNTYQRVP